MNKIFIIGLPRTGTTSISVALLEHGFKVAHTAFTKHAFEIAQVISDAPCFSDYRQLDALFPGSKFVYLERDLASWVPSMQMLLGKMGPQLHNANGHFHPVLKRSFNTSFELSLTADAASIQHLQRCFLAHQESVLNYFSSRDDLLSINIAEPDSFSRLLKFIGLNPEGAGDFPRLNVGTRVSSWKSHKHPNKVNSYSAGREHRKFFDYQ